MILALENSGLEPSALWPLNNIGSILLSTVAAAVFFDERLSKSGIAVCPASTVAYEYCCSRGVLFLIKTADNQDNIYQYLINSGCAITYEKISSQKFNVNANLKIIENQKILFDGKSSMRLIEIFKLLDK